MPQNGNDANAENVLYARRGCGEGQGRGAVEFVFVLRFCKFWSRHVRAHGRTFTLYIHCVEIGALLTVNTSSTCAVFPTMCTR